MQNKSEDYYNPSWGEHCHIITIHLIGCKEILVWTRQSYNANEQTEAKASRSPYDIMLTDWG